MVDSQSFCENFINFLDVCQPYVIGVLVLLIISLINQIIKLESRYLPLDIPIENVYQSSTIRREIGPLFRFVDRKYLSIKFNIFIITLYILHYNISYK